MRERLKKQQGAALLIVLVLVATLSFVALGIMERTSLAAARSVNVRVKMEAHWYALGAEALAKTVMAQWRASDITRDALSDTIFAEPIENSIDDVTVRLALNDSTACFNVNSLADNTSANGAFGELPASARELALLISHLGTSEFEAERIASVIADWIDQDTSRLPQGAEDETYTTLPSPYRAGNGPVASVSELRAMKDISRDIYLLLKPYLCALPNSEPAPVNINMMTEAHAPIMAAALGPDVSLLQAAEIIAARPAAGYSDIDSFLTSSAIAGLELQPDALSRFTVKSSYVRANVEIVHHDAVMEMTTFLAVAENGDTTTLARRFGTEE